jgi:hypothetical protein
MEFALKSAFEISTRVFCPHPIGLARLKMASYQDEPAERVKDLADLAELAFGIVQHGRHFEMDEWWAKWKNDLNSKFVKKVLADVGKQISPQWDLFNAEAELKKRLFSERDIDEVLPAQFREWADYLD